LGGGFFVGVLGLSFWEFLLWDLGMDDDEFVDSFRGENVNYVVAYFV
jgi:hypothetical protein